MVEKRIISEVGRGVPVWGRTILFGLGAAGITGLLILAPGLRIAMRVVAIQDPFRHTEFSIGGTIFILVFFGLVMAMPLGLLAAALARFLARALVVIIVTTLGMAFVAADTEIIEEFMELGAGPWANFSMFGAVFALWAYVDLRLVARFERQVTSPQPDVPEEVQV